jgi:hypothetical protein
MRYRAQALIERQTAVDGVNLLLIAKDRWDWPKVRDYLAERA